MIADVLHAGRIATTGTIIPCSDLFDVYLSMSVA